MYNEELNLSDTILYFLKIASVKDCIKIINQTCCLDTSFLDEVFSYLRRKNKSFISKFINKLFSFNEDNILKNKFIFEFGL